MGRKHESVTTVEGANHRGRLNRGRLRLPFQRFWKKRSGKEFLNVDKHAPLADCDATEHTVGLSHTTTSTQASLPSTPYLSKSLPSVTSSVTQDESPERVVEPVRAKVAQRPVASQGTEMVLNKPSSGALDVEGDIDIVESKKSEDDDEEIAMSFQPFDETQDIPLFGQFQPFAEPDFKPTMFVPIVSQDERGLASRPPAEIRIPFPSDIKDVTGEKWNEEKEETELKFDGQFEIGDWDERTLPAKEINSERRGLSSSSSAARCYVGTAPAKKKTARSKTGSNVEQEKKPSRESVLDWQPLSLQKSHSYSSTLERTARTKRDATNNVQGAPARAPAKGWTPLRLHRSHSSTKTPSVNKADMDEWADELWAEEKMAQALWTGEKSDEIVNKESLMFKVGSFTLDDDEDDDHHFDDVDSHLEFLAEQKKEFGTSHANATKKEVAEYATPHRMYSLAEGSFDAFSHGPGSVKLTLRSRSAKSCGTHGSGTHDSRKFGTGTFGASPSSGASRRSESPALDTDFFQTGYSCQEMFASSPGQSFIPDNCEGFTSLLKSVEEKKSHAIRGFEELKIKGSKAVQRMASHMS